LILVDTDILIDVMRKYPPALQWLGSLSEEEILVPGYVAMELVQGCRNKAEQDTVLRELRKFHLVWPAAATCDQAFETFTELRLSAGVGIIDTLIGQTAVELGLPLHTFNVKHYSPIPGLQTVQPYRRA
jgi:predicted nucleic acid-binding protein